MKEQCWVLLASFLATGAVNAETMLFSYTFSGDAFQPYAPGSVLFGQIDGTVDPGDLNSVIVNSFGTVSLSRPGLPLFTFPSIQNNEFNTNPPGNTPVMSFDGTMLDFRACPSGFTFMGIDCAFATEGGFLVLSDAPFTPPLVGFTTAADGTGVTAACGGVSGCRVTDRNDLLVGLPGTWSLVVLPDDVDPNALIDPTVVIGPGSSVSQGVVLEKNVELGENVSVDKNTSIGADTVIEGDVEIGKNVDIGSEVTIGTEGSADQNVVIENNVTIGAFTTIDQGVHICAGVTIGELVTIGKNNLITENVPDTSELPGVQSLAGDCP